MKLLIISVLFAAVVVASEASIFDHSEWTEFKETYNKTYTKSEDKLRMKVFYENKKYIEGHNARYAKGETTYKLGINEYADMTQSEFARSRIGLKLLQRWSIFGWGKHVDVGRGKMNITTSTNKTRPGSIDWREKGAVTPVKRQGACGGCWAFSTTGALEGQYFRKTGKLVSFSEQNLIDCAKTGNFGCKGGWAHKGFDYIRDNKGINTEADYPYEYKVGQCRYNASNFAATITGQTSVDGSDNVLEAVATIGPVSTYMDASQDLRAYKKGVFTYPKCSRENHVVLIVGYGTTSNGIDYWIVKNSWGNKWGEGGYVKMARQNNCNFGHYGAYPLL